jgi:hypothetical protein
MAQYAQELASLTGQEALAAKCQELFDEYSAGKVDR